MNIFNSIPNLILNGCNLILEGCEKIPEGCEKMVDGLERMVDDLKGMVDGFRKKQNKLLIIIVKGKVIYLPHSLLFNLLDRF